MNDARGNPPPGWYPDGRGSRRWWDGSRWTQHTDAGSGAGPGPGWGAGSPAQSAQGRPGPGRPARGQAGPAQPLQAQPGPTTYLAPGPAAPVGWGAPGGFPGSNDSTNGSSNNNKVLIGVLAGLGVLLVASLVVLVVLLVGSGSDTDSSSADRAGGAGSGTSEGESEDSEGGSADVPAVGEAATTAEDYLRARILGDYVRSCELSSASYRELSVFALADVSTCADLEGNESLPEPLEPPEGLELELLVDVIDSTEDTTAVEYRFGFTDGDIGAPDPEEDRDGTVDLVVEDGEWRVDDEGFG